MSWGFFSPVILHTEFGQEKTLQGSVIFHFEKPIEYLVRPLGLEDNPDTVVRESLVLLL